MRNVTQCNTFYNMRVDPITKSLLILTKLEGKDFREYLLKAMIYKLEKGVRDINPEVLNNLDELEKVVLSKKPERKYTNRKPWE